VCATSDWQINNDGEDFQIFGRLSTAWPTHVSAPMDAPMNVQCSTRCSHQLVTTCMLFDLINPQRACAARHEQFQAIHYSYALLR